MSAIDLAKPPSPENTRYEAIDWFIIHAMHCVRRLREFNSDRALRLVIDG